MSRSDPFHRADEPTRRAFLGQAAAGLLGVSGLAIFGPGVTARTTSGGTARNVIYLYMAGGMSHLDTLDVKPGAETQGATEAIPTQAEGVLIGHRLPNLARHLDKATVIRSMQTTQGAHEQGRYYLHTGYLLRGTIQHPSLGAWLARFQGGDNPSLPPHVEIGGTRYTAQAGFLASRFAPLPIGDPTRGLQSARPPESVDASTVARRQELLAAMNQEFLERRPSRRVRAAAEMYDQAVELMRSEDLAAFDLGLEDERIREAYGSEAFGQGCLLARRLVEHGVRFVEVVLGGWDTHVENFEALDERCPILDQALSTLLADLDARGLLEETLVVLATEFGRTPRINQNNGRDHYPQAFSCLLAGGGIAGGRAYGATDPTGSEILDSPVSIPDFNATIAWALGLPLEEQVFSESGRPFTVAGKGRPVLDLFA